LDLVQCEGLVHPPYSPELKVCYLYFVEQAEGRGKSPARAWYTGKGVVVIKDH